MSSNALFNIFALAAVAGSAAAQVTSSASATTTTTNTLSTYPATPLASKTFSYPSGIVRLKSYTLSELHAYYFPR